MTPQSNGERILRLNEAFEQEGPEAVGKLIDETFDDDIEFIPLQTGEVHAATSMPVRQDLSLVYEFEGVWCGG
jgi:hypothetical protein